MLAVGLITAAVSKATSDNYDLCICSPLSHVSLFAAYWIMAYSQSRRSLILLSVPLVSTAFAFWSGLPPHSQALFLSVCGLCAIWFDKVPMPRIAAVTISWVAACSFYVCLAQFAPIYLRDREVWPDTALNTLAMALAAIVLSLALGGVAHYMADRAVDVLRKLSPKQVAHGSHRV